MRVRRKPVQTGDGCKVVWAGRVNATEVSSHEGKQQAGGLFAATRLVSIGTQPGNVRACPTSVTSALQQRTVSTATRQRASV